MKEDYKIPLKYRGVEEAVIVSVCEGDGVNTPYDIINYVVQQVNGKMTTVGKVVNLSEDEKNFIGVIS